MPFYVTPGVAKDAGGVAFDPKKTKITEDRHYFEKGKNGSFSAVIIKTNKGTIRLFGLHLRDRMKLSNHLMELNQNIQWL